jgi:hypothetical protein
MNALSQFAANNCENAKNDVCHCRCNGALHGARRLKTNDAGDTDPIEFEKLPEDDPHFVPSKKRAKELAKERKREKKRLEREARYNAQKKWNDEHPSYYNNDLFPAY